MIPIHSISLGCPKNRVDTERTLGALANLAGSVTTVQQPEKARLVFINTCAFISPAVQESVRTLLEVTSRLETLPAHTRPLLAVAGCLVGRYGKKQLAPDLPEVNLLLDNRDIANWPSALYAALAERLHLPAPRQDGPTPGPIRLLSTSPSYAWLKISDGCRHTCSFCTIPSIRGPLVSTPAALLKREASLLLEQGIKELVLAAQDSTAWGKDLGLSHGLVSLLENLLSLDGLKRLRLMYLYPAGINRELLAFLQQAGPPFVPYFDVPLQHAAKNVLSRMGRPFVANPASVVERIRAFFPDAALRTSIITGFPGETEADFEELCRFVQSVRFHHLGVFAYQAEEGTLAATMPGQIPNREKQWRRDTLMQLQAEISAAILQEQVGKRLPVLVDSPHGEWPGLHTGRTWFQAPESDGVTYVSGPGVFPGTLVEADIIEAAEYDLVALADAGMQTRQPFLDAGGSS